MSASPGPWRWGLVDEDGDELSTDSLHDANGIPIGFYNEGRDNSPTNPNARLIASAPEMAAMLRELEWHGNRFDPALGGVRGCCPMCHAFTELGNHPGAHSPDCRLAAILERLGR